MKIKTTTLFLLPLTLLLFLLTGCEFIGNAFEYRKTTEEFTEALLREDYDRCVEFFATELPIIQEGDVERIRAGLPEFRQTITRNFGDELEYTLMKAEKVFSTVEGESTPPNTTQVHVQIENRTDFGILQLSFDDTYRKIINVTPLNLKKPVPNMLPFWLFGLFALCVPIFNIFVINRIRKSNLKRKWLKYLGVLFFNVPAVTYSPVAGLGISLLSFQILLGISFSYTGYLNAMWAFGVPLGGLYWLWRLKVRQKDVSVREDFGDTEVIDA